MAEVNPQPLQSRPYSDHVQIPPPIQIDDDEDDCDYEDSFDDAEDGHVTSVNAHEHHHVSSHGGFVVPSRTSELTLAFEGEVYVFPSVTPEKVKLGFFFF